MEIFAVAGDKYFNISSNSPINFCIEEIFVPTKYVSVVSYANS